MSYIIGIDLGTTNSALAATDLSQEDLAGGIECLPVEQLIAPAEVSARPLLPSSLYLLEGPELPKGSTKLPWTKEDLPYITGEFAKEQGAKVPGRLVQSAKSWLCHPGVDRSANILPWGADDWIQKLSPVEASARFLIHLRDAWNTKHPNEKLEDQEIVLTVPASFDDIARTLTLEAAKRASFKKVRLLEEPQAAFYSFLLSHRQHLQSALQNVRVVLVIDIGGGTSDFSLIEVTSGGAIPKLQRIAVGEHILLGGDNIDQALARKIESQTIGENKLDGARFWQLVQSCRLAKEAMLAPDGPPSYPIKILARGSRLLGGTISYELKKEEVLSLVLEGFFPSVPLGAEPQKAARAGLKELGLPYATDPAIPKHLSSFLKQYPEATPDAILFNGGVLKPEIIKQHIVGIVRGWFPQKEIQILESASLDLAVARGACAYGVTRRGVGISIGGGAARGYYAAIEVNQKQMGLCLVPKGSEEGLEISIERGLSLRVGRPVRFPLFTSTTRRDAPGELVALDKSFAPLPPIQTILEGDAGEVPVDLVSMMTEVGTIELSLAARGRSERWRLEFQTAERSSLSSGSAPGPHAKLPEALSQIQLAFGPKGQPRDARNLGRVLEKTLGRERGEWPMGLCRDLFDALRERASFRRTSLDTESAWLNLSGFLLRPGFGQNLDDWRVKELWKLYGEGLAHRNEKRVRLEWWILWRRVAGGLWPEAQEEVYNAFGARMRVYGQEEPPEDPKHREEHSKDQELDEVIRLAANLERLPEAKRAELGNLFLQRAETWGARGPLLWAVGRIGARILFYGSGLDVIRRSIVERWVRRVLALEWKTAEGAPFAVAQMARRTGGRDIDLDEDLRLEVIKRLEAHHAPAAYITMVKEITELESREQQQIFGESLPSGLRLSE